MLAGTLVAVAIRTVPVLSSDAGAAATVSDAPAFAVASDLSASGAAVVFAWLVSLLLL